MQNQEAMPPKGSRKPIALRGGVCYYSGRREPWRAEMQVDKRTQPGPYRKQKADAEEDLAKMRAAPSEEAVVEIADGLRAEDEKAKSTQAQQHQASIPYT